MIKKIIAFMLMISLFASNLLISVPAIAESVHSMSSDELEAYIAYLQIVLQNKRKEEGTTYTATEVQITSAPTEEQINVIFNGGTYTGTYDGDLQDGKPHGSGTFEGYYQKNKLTYTGEWINGEISGIGTVEADAYTLHFDDREGVYDRVGSYVGDVVNGLPEGNGTFKTEVGASNPWKYTGEWKAGMFNGQGRQTWENESTVKEGTFTNNEFTPTATDAFLYTAHKKEFEITSKSKTALSAYSSYFTGRQKKSLPDENLIDTDFDLKQYKKRPADYGDKLIYVSNAKVFQVLTWEIGNKTVEQILMETEDDDIYFGFYYGKSNIIEDMEISAYVLPFDWDTYKNVSGDEVWAVFCAITDYVGDKASVSPPAITDLSRATVGGIIKFGNSRWKVLKLESDRMLVISQYVVYKKNYHSKDVHVTWADCDLRKWLNGEYILTNFSSTERQAILTVENQNTGKDPFGFTVKNGKSTKDQVFVLKYEEAKTYYTALLDTSAECWLRTPDNWGNNYLFSPTNWKKEEFPATSVSNSSIGIRPAMWIKRSFSQNQKSTVVPTYTSLQQGESGTLVFEMKERMQELGYFSAGAALSDKYNSTTTERVKLFQKANGLKQTGIANEETLQLLYSENAKRNPY